VHDMLLLRRLLMLLNRALYDGYTSCVCVGNQISPGFLMPLGCIRAAWLHQTDLQLVWSGCSRGMKDIAFGQCSFTDLWTLQMIIPSGWAAGAPCSCSRGIPGGNCTTQSRSELAKNNGPCTWLLSRTSLQVFASVGMVSNVRNHLST